MCNCAHCVVPKIVLFLRFSSFFWSLPQKSSQNLPTNELFAYISCVDNLILSPSQIFNHFMCIYNSNGQLVLKVLKSDDGIFLLKDLHDRTLWTIQIIKNCWPFRPKEAHVSYSTLFSHLTLYVVKKKFFPGLLDIL